MVGTGGGGSRPGSAAAAFNALSAGGGGGGLLYPSSPPRLAPGSAVERIQRLERRLDSVGDAVDKSQVKT